MKNKEAIHKEIEKTMHSLDGLKRAATDDYFFSRLEARIDNRYDEKAEPAFSWGIAAVMLVILCNIATFFYFAGGAGYSEAGKEEITAMAEEYSLTVPSVYEYEPEINE